MIEHSPKIFASEEKATTTTTTAATPGRRLGDKLSGNRLLGPSHTRRPSVGFRAARQRRYKTLLLLPVCGAVPLGSLVLSLTLGVRNTCRVE